MKDWVIIPTMFQNNQPQETQQHSLGTSIEIVDVFHTLQGEGPFTGEPSIFIRLAGCNLKCPYCDTDYTTNRRFINLRTLVHDEIGKILSQYPFTKLVVITGGEPLRQNIVPLIISLDETFGVHIQIESNGVYAPRSDLVALIIDRKVTYIVSPKTSKIAVEAGRFANVFKYVLQADNLIERDGLPKQALGHRATPHVARPPEGFLGRIYVNPMDEQDAERNKANMIACRDSALRFGYIMGTQAHKEWGLP